MKRCNACQVTKSLDGFYSDRSKKDGRNGTCKECTLTRRKQYYLDHRDEMRQYFREYYLQHPWSERRRSEYLRLKIDALQRYGGVCVCCGEGESIFLTFDHVHNDGAEHRSKDRSAANIVLWLKRNDYPVGVIQILCFNCNQAKHLNGGVCPHQIYVDQ